MAETKTYRVLRPMQGDRDYQVGDTRELTDAEAQPMLGRSLELAGKQPARKAPSAAKPKSGKAKADAVLTNKAEAILTNKAAGQ